VTSATPDSAAAPLTAAIDVHAHFGAATGHGNAVRDRFMSGDENTVLRRAQVTGTALTFCSPLRALLPRRDNDAVAGNEESRRLISGRRGLRYWVVVDPRCPATFEQAAESLADPWCVGIKIHPEEHVYPIAVHGLRLFELAARHGAVLQSHSGEPNSLPADFLPFADQFPEVTLILSHLGCGYNGDPTHQVRAIQACRHGNVYTDTSSAQSIMPNLIEWATREVGAERILYGTDSPVYFAPMQRARIDHAEIDDTTRQLILAGNAERVFRERLSAAPATAGRCGPAEAAGMPST
jgi:predicted TIM-barrel fold metal-dependent hydrolase